MQAGKEATRRDRDGGDGLMESIMAEKPRHAHFADQLTRASFVNLIRAVFW
jgi:hypothetical protein